MKYYPVGYKADADYYCVGHAVELYGVHPEKWDDDVKDGEGNEVVPFYSWQPESNEYCCVCRLPLM